MASQTFDLKVPHTYIGEVKNFQAKISQILIFSFPESVAMAKASKTQSTNKVTSVAKTTKPVKEVISQELADLFKSHDIIEDGVRAVVAGRTTGLYLYGRAGVSKSHIVKTHLERNNIEYKEIMGHLTPIGLFNCLVNNPDKIIVIDDVTSIFYSQQGRQMLLAALGKRHDKGPRLVMHETAKGPMTTMFSGGIIALSNLSLESKNPIMRAVADRISVMGHKPTDHQVIDLIRYLAKYKKPLGLNAAKASEVAEYMIQRCIEWDVSPSIRLYIDKCLPRYQQWEAGESTCHWHDLVDAEVKGMVGVPDKPQRDISKQEQIEADRRTALQIYLANEDKEARVAAWQKATGSSQAVFYRRIKELKANGDITKDMM